MQYIKLDYHIRILDVHIYINKILHVREIKIKRLLNLKLTREQKDIISRHISRKDQRIKRSKDQRSIYHSRNFFRIFSISSYISPFSEQRHYRKMCKRPSLHNPVSES